MTESNPPDFFNFYHFFATDKGSIHSYIESYYACKFNSIRMSPVKLLEIGVDKGSSIKLWSEWFVNGTIYGIDCNSKWFSRIESLPNVKLIAGEGYCNTTLEKFEDNFFDFIIDDGPHTLVSQLYSIDHWLKKIKPGGTLIIEDVSSDENIEFLKNKVFKENLGACRLFDFRTVKKRFDDVIIEITKTT